MSEIIECNVVQPPTGELVLDAVLNSIEEGEFAISVETDTRVPRPVRIDMMARLGELTMTNPDYQAVITARVINPEDTYASLTLYISRDKNVAASAALITKA